MSEKNVKCFSPFHDSKKWKHGEWYPLPCGSFERDQSEYIVNGWGIFQREKNDKVGDIEPVHPVEMTFMTALRMCEEHNGRIMLGIVNDTD